MVKALWQPAKPGVGGYIGALLVIDLAPGVARVVYWAHLESICKPHFEESPYFYVSGADGLGRYHATCAQ